MIRTIQVLKSALPYQNNPDVARETNEVIDALDRALTNEAFEEGDGDELDVAVTNLETTLNTADEDEEFDDIEPEEDEV